MARIFASERSGASQNAGRVSKRAVSGSDLEGLQHEADASAGAQHLFAIQRAADTVQCMEDEELLQGKAQGDALSVEPVQLSPDGASGQGLPSELQAGVESLSGIDMDGVQVHYNSAKPSQLQAHAFAQGSTIHLGRGQERHLPHEAWHVAQQAQGRVKPTGQLAGQNLNDDAALENEADQMGARAMKRGAERGPE